MKTMIEHVALRVTDLDRSIDFYRKVLGFKPVSRRKLADRTITQVVFRVGEDVLVLFASPNFQKSDEDLDFDSRQMSTTAGEKWDRKWGGGIDHIAFSFDKEEYDNVVRRVGENGYKVHRGPERNLGAFGVGYATYFYDPDNVEVEIKYYDDPPEQPGDEWYETGDKMDD
jgi:catechol 2,3-dioxygenase-like lactoylglutathione lyase family enzyme